MNQALKAARLATNDPKIHKQLLDYTASHLSNIDLNKTPAENGEPIYKKIREITGVYDPYKKIKQQSIDEAKKIYDKASQIINNSQNKLQTAVKIAIAGNIIDFGINNTTSISDDLEKIITQKFAINDFDKFKKKIKTAKKILYIADNAGESVFDKLLIKQINKPTTYATRQVPVINDVTIEDAIASGIEEIAEIISSGSPAPGTILHLCNKKFIETYNQADIIISKGQGNYEGLSNEKKPIFFLLKAKCPVIAKDLNVNVGNIIIKAINI
jgi:hypothetical protein